MRTFAFLFVAILAGGLAFLFQSPLALIVSGFCLVSLAFSFFLSQKTAETFASERSQDKTLVAPGDRVAVRVGVSAAGGGRWQWSLIRDRVPMGIRVEGSPARLLFGQRDESTRLTYVAVPEARGKYTLGPATMEYGDLFGQRSTELADAQVGELWVHPRLVAVPALRLLSTRLTGPERAKASILEDPSLQAGCRAYAAGDPLKRIHWPASARTGSLVSKIYEHSSDPAFVVALATERECYADAGDFELACIVTASLSLALQDAGYKVGTLAGEWVPPRVDGLQRALTLKALAEAKEDGPSFAFQLLAVQPGFPWRATLIVVAGKLDDLAIAELRRLRKAGHESGVIVIGQDWEGNQLARAASIGASVASVKQEKDIASLRFLDPGR